MSTLVIIGIAIVLLVVLLIGPYNALVRLRNHRENAFADIDVQLKQRFDLIPQLVATVKGYATHEHDTLVQLTAARSGYMSATTTDQKVAADNALTKAMGALNVQVEAYPELKANQNFLQLQEEIADLENKLAAARRYFNSTTRELNIKVESFPSNIVAGMFGFRKEVMFDLGANRATFEEAPKINF